MSGDHADSSQVGLFSAQISEQIQRLRMLGEAVSPETIRSTPTELRRAVMATRLLAGSARILHFQELQGFLDDLLEWLQAVEERGRELTTTESLLLESVVDLEETLMRHLDAGGQTAVDLSSFREPIADLQLLIQRNLTETRAQAPAPPREPEARAAPASPEPSPDPSPGLSAESAAESLEAAVRRLRELLDGEATVADLEVLLSGLDETVAELNSIYRELSERSQAERVPTRPSDPNLGPALKHPHDDPLYADALRNLEEVAARRGLRLVFRAHGGARLVEKGMQDLARALIAALLGDLVDELRDLSAGRPVHVSVDLRTEQGRLIGRIQDDLPAGSQEANVHRADHLAVLPGLRQARAILAQTQGLLRTGRESGDARYCFTLPLSAEHPRYAVLHRGEEGFALPAAWLEEIIGEVEVESDPDGAGESIRHHGQTIALVDPTNLTAAAAFQPEPGAHIAILGSVEKRIALRCDGSLELHAGSEIGDAPAGWEQLAYGSLDVGNEVLVVLDVPALLHHRFGRGDRAAAGSVIDPIVDSFVPVSSTTSQRIRRALVVNQSEFRRRELVRTLQGQGMSVMTAESLSAASEELESGELEVLFSDLRLGTDTEAGFQQLQDRHPDLRIVLTTSVARSHAENLARRTGADAVWREPFQVSDLREILAGFGD